MDNASGRPKLTDMLHLSSKRMAEKPPHRSLAKVSGIVKFTLRYLPAARTTDKSFAGRSNTERILSVPIAGGSAQL